MKYSLAALLIYLLVYPILPGSGQLFADKTAQSVASVSANAEKKAAKEAKLKAAAEQKARKAAEKKAAAEAKAKAEAEKKAKKEAEKKAAREAKLKAEAEQKARKAAEKEAAAEAKAKAAAEKKAKKEAEKKAEQEIRAKKEAEKKAAREAKLKAEAEQKARKAAEKKAAAEAKAKAAAEKKAERAAELKAREEVEALKKTASKARAEAKQKAAQAAQAAQAAKKVAADKKASPEAKRKAQEQAAAKEIEAKEAAGKAASREAEAKKARADFETSRQDKIKARQKAEVEAKARKAAEKKAAIEAKIKAQEEARAKKAEARRLAREEPVGERVAKWWKHGLESAAKPEETGQWKLSAGVLLRTIRSQSFKTYSYSENYNIPARAGAVFRRHEPAGDLNSYSDRNYEDGYVHQDDYTDLDGGTWNWGYDNSSQVQGDSIVFRFAGRTYTEYTRSREITVGETRNNSDREIAPYIQLERVLYQRRWLDAGLHLDLSRVTFSDQARHANFSDSQAWKNYVQYDEDVYSLADTGITPESPPYQGNRTTPGPAIDNIPALRRGAGTVEKSANTYNAYNDIQQSLEMNLGTASIGMLMSANYWRLTLSGIAGPTFNWVNMQTSYLETLYASSNNGNPETLQTWRDSRDYSAVKFGGFVQAQLGLRIIDGLGLGIFGRYDWLENMSGNIGQSRFVINPEGGSFGGAVNLNF